MSIIEKIMWILSTILCLGSLLFFGAPQQLGVSVGCAFMLINVAFWRWTIRRFLQKAQNSANGESRSVLVKLVLLGQLKLVLMVGVLFAFVRFVPADRTFLLVGLLVLPMSALVWAFYRTARDLSGRDRVSVEVDVEKVIDHA